MWAIESFRNAQSERRGEAKFLYEEMCRRRWWRKMVARLRGRSYRLLPLSDIEETYTITNRYDAGIRTVPIHQIRGSENRTNEFDIDFRPLNDRVMTRWETIAEAQLRGVTLSPVTLIQVGEIYFVRDGHCRISVARTLGQSDIDARVTIWEVGHSQSQSDITTINLRQHRILGSVGQVWPQSGGEPAPH